MGLVCSKSLMWSESESHSVFETPWMVPHQAPPSVFQARLLEWVATSFSRGSSLPRDRTGSPALKADSLLSGKKPHPQPAGSPNAKGRSGSSLPENSERSGQKAPKISAQWAIGIRGDCRSLLKKVMAPHSSTLAWKIPWTEESGGLQSMGSRRVGHDWGLHFHFLLSCIGEGNGNPLQCSCLENPRDGGAS